MALKPDGERHVRNGRTAAAERIAVEASRLARMATASDFALLSYLIDMVVLEAWREAGDAAAADGTDGATAGDDEPNEPH